MKDWKIRSKRKRQAKQGENERTRLSSEDFAPFETSTVTATTDLSYETPKNRIPTPGDTQESDEPQRSKTFWERMFSKLGFGVLLIMLFLLSLSPAVMGYVWFGDRNIWSISYLELMLAHPYYFHRTLLVAAIFAFIYATVMAWLVLKIKRLRKQIFVVLFVGSFGFSIYICNWLLENNIITYWSW